MDTAKIRFDVARMARPSLEEVLAYSNSDVVYRFQKTYGVTREQSEDIFVQVRKWLWLSHQHRLAGFENGLFIDKPLIVIDEMWHNFVLFTTEYFAFCRKYFGYYIHHAPATEAEDREGSEKYGALAPDERIRVRKEQLRPQYEFIYDHLGKETLAKWYLEYPKIFSFRRLAEMQLQAANEKLAEVRREAMAA